MVSINLLKGQRQDERGVRRRCKVELGVGACVLIGVGAFWGWVAVDVNHATQQLEREIQAKRARVTLSQQIRQEVLALEERRQAVVTERNRFKTLTSESGSPIPMLSVISKVVDPLDMWLLHLQAKNEKVTLSGLARSFEDVLKLAKDFEKTEGFGPVDLVDAGPHVQQPDLFQFSMTVLLTPTDHGRTSS